MRILDRKGGEELATMLVGVADRRARLSNIGRAIAEGEGIGRYGIASIRIHRGRSIQVNGKRRVTMVRVSDKLGRRRRVQRAGHVAGKRECARVHQAIGHLVVGVGSADADRERIRALSNGSRAA